MKSVSICIKAYIKKCLEFISAPLCNEVKVIVKVSSVQLFPTLGSGALISVS